MQNLNKIKIAPDSIYEIGQDKVGYFPGWSVKDDATLYEKVYKLAHSTFDPSKFTVVGSPNITDDGIASGFSSNTKIQTIEFNPINKPWEITIAFKADTVPSVNAYYLLTQYQNNITLRIVQGLFEARVHAGSWDTDTVLDYNYVINANANYKVTIGYSTTGYYVKLFNLDTNSIVDSYSNTNTGVIYDGSTNKLTLGNHNTAGNMPFSIGSIDLKQFSITVDGVEVYKAWQPQALKYWTGTKTEYDAIATKNANTLKK